MITPFVDQTSIQALAWSLVHFLWQGDRARPRRVRGVEVIPRLRATTRYLTGVATLIAMLAAPMATFFYLNRSTVQIREGPAVRRRARPFRPPTVSPAEAGPYAGPATPQDFAPSSTAADSDCVPLGPFVILIVWLSGVVLLSLRLLGGWIVARRLITRAVRPCLPKSIRWSGASPDGWRSIAWCASSNRRRSPCR